MDCKAIIVVNRQIVLDAATQRDSQSRKLYSSLGFILPSKSDKEKQNPFLLH